MRNTIPGWRRPGPSTSCRHYVGPREKEQFIQFLTHKLRDRKLESLVRNLFRPSYGGNRNFTLMYTLGAFMVSADDDMRPHALIESSPESLTGAEISRGKLLKPGFPETFSAESFDLLKSFQDVLGHARYARSPPTTRGVRCWLIPRWTWKPTSPRTSRAITRCCCRKGWFPGTRSLKIAQTFRSGTNDIDALDFVHMYLHDESQRQANLHEFNDLYVLVNFRPAVTKKNWRMDCGVAGYDNRLGLPPFFPTRLRFEDYIYRLWIQQPRVVSAHIDCSANAREEQLHAQSVGHGCL